MSLADDAPFTAFDTARVISSIVFFIFFDWRMGCQVSEYLFDTQRLGISESEMCRPKTDATLLRRLDRPTHIRKYILLPKRTTPFVEATRRPYTWLRSMTCHHHRYGSWMDEALETTDPSLPRKQIYKLLQKLLVGSTRNFAFRDLRQRVSKRFVHPMEKRRESLGRKIRWKSLKNQHCQSQQ